MMKTHQNQQRGEDMSGRYMAYIGSYTDNYNAKGITVCDVDVGKGSLTYREEVEVDNSSYVIASNDGKTLYSITDEGIASFRINDDGSLFRLGTAKIKGMRGRHLSMSPDGKFIFVCGYHDGKITVLKIKPDGSVGAITDGVFHKGFGGIAERNFRPHPCCSAVTPDGKYLLVSDLGLDFLKLYSLDPKSGKLTEADTVHCELESAPRLFLFSADGRFLYVIYEIKNVIDVFSYEEGDRLPVIEKIQTIPTTDDHQSYQIAACALRMGPDDKHLFCSNAGANTVSMYDRDTKTGLLTQRFCLPISGDYPKDILILPDGNHLASFNNATGSVTFFNIDYKKGVIVMSGRDMMIEAPNSCALVKIGE